MKKKVIVSAAILGFSFSMNAKENVPGSGIRVTNNQYKSVMSNCAPATHKAELDINNVRATILAGGDMWWDLFDGSYFVPKPAPGAKGQSSMFAGSLWIGGYDVGGALKVAAMTYRQTGNDFWPGPLSSAASTDASTCLAWDNHFIINRADVEDFNNWFTNGMAPGYSIPSSIRDWPVEVNGESLAPYYDADGNGIYDPLTGGDYPDFDLDGSRGCNAKLYGDQSMFWVFNDKGNIHSETGGTPIGLEIQAQAFGFQSNDEINNMTFYTYRIINRSSFRMDSTFFGIWCDSDLGAYNDDYVGCDVGLGLGYSYNGDLIDGPSGNGELIYGPNPPAIGIDFFEGPFADPDGIDNPASSVPKSFLGYGDGVADNERLGMGRFVYYNNDQDVVNGNPSGADDIYQYLTATWRNGTPVTYGGDGKSGSVACKYMFPGTSDPLGYGTGMISQTPWDEVSVGNTPADRRFLQSAGPFTLQPGAVNTITMGVVWARATQGGNTASLALVKGADVKAQNLFNNCFATLNGPTAPHLAVQELDREIVLTWSNPANSNNYNESYSEDYDKSTGADSVYRFQGYMIYQLKDGSVASTDLYDVDRARLVFQCDKTDAVSQIVNYTNDLTISALVPTLKVNGENKGIEHSVSIKEDKFATGDNRLVNHKTYYYAIIAYGYSPTQLPTNLNQLIDYNPFIAGRKQADGYFVHSAIPHITSPEANGTEQHAKYGTGPKLRRIEGQGNGGNILDLTEETVSKILSSPESRVINPVYENGAGPVDIMVVDPLNVPEDNEFRFLLYGKDSISRWDLVNLTTGDTVHSETIIGIPNHQLINGQITGMTSKVIPKWGLSVSLSYTYDPGSERPNAIKNSFLEATMTFKDESRRWLTGVKDQDGENVFNWIRSGSAEFENNKIFDDEPGDPNQDYEKVIEGTWAPYRLCGFTPDPIPAPLDYIGGPAWEGHRTANSLKNVASVDVVITSDKSKWTRCPVIELQEYTSLAEGGAKKMHMRKSPSVDKEGRKAGDPGYNAADGNWNGTEGMGWFPGYAINLETGERLNMAFGEDSWLKEDNGADMIWNPSSRRLVFDDYGDPVFGGRHYVYVFGHNGDGVYGGNDPQLPGALRDVPRYDGGKVQHDLFVAAAATTNNTSDGYKREVYADAMWVNIPLLEKGHKLLETDVKIRLRVARSYQKGYSSGNRATILATGTGISTDLAASPINNNFPTYEFNTSDIEAHTNNAEAAKMALDLINIVPNPYYAYSGYEQSTLQNIVKITNLPEKCKVTIYTLNGNLVRKFNVDQPSNARNTVGVAVTSLDWDLKNQARVPVASGMYIIHVDVPGVGERILKWFGVMRPIDLESY